jgi:hypothetical protein
MKISNYLRVVWPKGFDERAAFELPYKGWLRVNVESENGCRFSLYFTDPVRLQQELDEAVSIGRPYFAEPGLIILPEVTVEAITDAVQFLWDQDYFETQHAVQGDASMVEMAGQFA